MWPTGERYLSNLGTWQHIEKLAAQIASQRIVQGQRHAADLVQFPFHESKVMIDRSTRNCAPNIVGAQCMLVKSERQ